MTLVMGGVSRQVIFRPGVEPIARGRFFPWPIRSPISLT
jgi:hypothetical protein